MTTSTLTLSVSGGQDLASWAAAPREARADAMTSSQAA
jgi:hypothetical protein